MNCGEIRNLTPLWLTGELDDHEKGSFEEHLSGCAGCKREIEEQRALDLRIRLAVQGEPLRPVVVNRAVLREINAARLGRRLAWTAIAAALLTSLIVGYAVRAKAGTPRIYADAARDHQTEVLEHGPRKWRVDAAGIAELAQRFGLTAAGASSLAPQGFHLLHAKTCRLEGRPALHLVYTDGGREISVYVRQPEAAPAATDAAEIGAERLAYAKGTGRSVVVVTTGTADECRKLARRAAELL